MGDDELRRKRLPQRFWFQRQAADNSSSPFAEEENIVELISLGAALPSILNKLCSALDVQIGDVVSLFSLPDEELSHLCADAQSAMQMGLSIFSSRDIHSPDGALLATLEIYGCGPRLATPHEYQLIERVTSVAAIALQQHKDAEEFERFSRNIRCAKDGKERERPRFIN